MPDITTKEQYQQYQHAIAEFITHEELTMLSTGCWDYEHDGPQPEDWEGEPWFSWVPCEMCGCELGGDREYLYARQGKEKEFVQYQICEDCVYYVEYGPVG